jgi:hypothetical protein
MSAWDLRSNIKAKEGSQGTLFQVADKDALLNPQQRWPRGYTPERQSEVRERLDQVRFTTSNQFTRPRDEAVQRARVTDTVARSTMPARHLALLNQVDDTPMPGTHGTYYPQARRLHVNMSADAESEQTLIHELGHHNANVTPKGGDTVRQHVSNLAETAGRDFMPKHADADAPLTGTARALGAKAVKSGVEEAYADNYMTEHFRTRGRNPKPVTEGRYEANWTAAERQQRYPGYNDVRPPAALSEHQFADTPLPGMPDSRRSAARQDANDWARK